MVKRKYVVDPKKKEALDFVCRIERRERQDMRAYRRARRLYKKTWKMMGWLKQLTCFRFELWRLKEENRQRKIKDREMKNE